jgi:hypothetical protein
MKPQTARVLAALRTHSDRGITRVDFLLPDVIDGREPIINVPARINELKEDGYSILCSGRRSKCRVYRLLEDESRLAIGEAA